MEAFGYLLRNKDWLALQTPGSDRMAGIRGAEATNFAPKPIAMSPSFVGRLFSRCRKILSKFRWRASSSCSGGHIPKHSPVR